MIDKSYTCETITKTLDRIVFALANNVYGVLQSKN